MKPFNLQEALAGRPVVDKYGKSVTNFHYFSEAADNQKLYGLDSDNQICAYSDNGQFFEGKKSESSYDLFMASEKKEGWVNVYRSSYNSIYTGDVHSSETEARKKCSEGSMKQLATVRISWEE